MDEGIIASRYAQALLRLVLERGDGEQVSAQAERIEQALHQVPQLREILDDPEGIAPAVKLGVFRKVLEAEPMADSLERFLKLLIRNDRMPLVELALHDFIDLFHKQQGILYVRLRSAVPPSEESLRRLKALVREKTGYEAVVMSFVDPQLIGGFVFEIEDYTLDASVRHQLNVIRRQFIDNNRRIV